MSIPEAYLEPSQISKMERFLSSILDIWLGSEYALTYH